jgi:hypothetical protein
MSWTEIAPRAKPSYQPFAGVEFAVGKLQGIKRDRADRPLTVLLTFRPGRLDGHPKFLLAGNTVKVLAGSGEHAGMLRIVPGASYRIGKCGGPAGTMGTSILRFPLPPGVIPKEGKSEPEYDYGENWLEVTVPAWARAPEPAATPPAANPPAGVITATKKGFRSALDGVPHQVRRGT